MNEEMNEPEAQARGLGGLTAGSSSPVLPPALSPG